jgi:hypothetical protein
MMIATSSFRAKTKSLDANFGLLIFLQIFAVILCFGGPLSIFAPVPIILALLVFGRMPALFFAGLFAAIIWYGSSKFPTGSGLFLNGIHLVAIVSGVLVSEIFFRNMNPVKGLLVTGFIFVALLGALFVSNEQMGKLKARDQISLAVDQVVKTIKENNKEVIEKGNDEARTIKSIISSQNEIVEEIMNFLPSILFVSSFFALWISLYSVLRLSKVWRSKILYSFGTRDLITFKTPEYFVYPLIAALVMVIGANYGLGVKAEVVGGNILYCLGIFYLFQGFGIFYDFLTFARIGGIFKSAIMAFVLMASFKFLAIIGMFDLWFDFRKYFTRKNNDEGDTL